MAELERMHILERSGDEIRATFPIIGPQAAAPLRRHARNLAEKLLPRLTDPVARIHDHLAAEGLTGHTFAVVFGHALDGLMWSILASHRAVPDTHLTPDRPYWNGTFWAIWPPRENPAGVNEARFPGMTLVMVWTPRTEEPLKALARRSGLQATLCAIASGASAPVADPLLLDDHGHSRIPIIRPGDPLQLHALALARPVAEALLTEPLPSIENVTDPRDARIIFGHELIWELADLLHDNGLVPRASEDDPIPSLFLRVEAG
ncbi:MAG: hypothetical protein ACK4R3_09895 [Aliihoeflea sp.]